MTAALYYPSTPGTGYFETGSYFEKFSQTLNIQVSFGPAATLSTMF